MTLNERSAVEADLQSGPGGAHLVHLHFGAGRLGLGLIATAFRKPGSAVYLFNRAVAGRKETGDTALDPARRNALLRDNPDRVYAIQKPGGGPETRRIVHYDGFFTYEGDDIEGQVVEVLDAETRRHARPVVVVTASVLKSENYGPVLRALNVVAGQVARGAVARAVLVACENTVSAHDVFRHEDLSTLLSREAREFVSCVHALVDRMCVGLEESSVDGHAAVLVRAEDYGSVKLELSDETQDLPALLAGTSVEFSRHVDTEKQIKNWLLNGTHWLVALKAFQDAEADPRLKLNAYLAEDEAHARFARDVMSEMRDGVAAILRHKPDYAAFVRDVEVDDYLDGAARAILARFSQTEDPITRILARFQAPTSDSYTSVVSFSRRLADRVDEPMRAFEAEHGTVPPAAAHSVQSLMRLIASGSFIDARSA